MLFNLLLAKITFFCTSSYYFLLFLAGFFFTILIETENARVKLILAIPTGAPITVANDAIEMLLVVTDKANNELSKYFEKQYIY